MFAEGVRFAALLCGWKAKLRNAKEAAEAMKRIVRRGAGIFVVAKTAVPLSGIEIVHELCHAKECAKC